MLKKILEDGVCPEEILNNISDEDKQLIFLEIRKEQLRKYKLREQTDSGSQIFRQSPNGKGKNVGFMDESQLVSFLGERAGDKPIEELLQEEALKKAQLEAERQIQKELESIKDSVINKANNPKIDVVSESQLVVTKSIVEEQPVSKQNPSQIPEKPVMKRNTKTAEQKREEMVKRKSTELYQTYINQITELEETAEKENEELTKYWKKVEEQAKFDEEQRRKLAEEARRLHAHINNDSTNDSNIFQQQLERPPLPSKKSDHLRFVINAIQKTNLMNSQHDIKSWFLEHEWNKLRVFDGRTDVVPIWFHGMINREETEELLDQKKFGTFLIRLSDKFQCYVLSYKAKSKIKHILIESKPDSMLYEFVGPTNVRSFVSLAKLIEFFQVRPLSDSNSDILTEPCGQKTGQIADYMHLLQPNCTNRKSASVICSL